MFVALFINQHQQYTLYDCSKNSKAPGKHVEERRKIASWFSKVLSKVASNNAKEILQNIAIPTFESIISLIKSAGHVGSVISIAVDAY